MGRWRILSFALDWRAYRRFLALCSKPGIERAILCILLGMVGWIAEFNGDYGKQHLLPAEWGSRYGRRSANRSIHDMLVYNIY